MKTIKKIISLLLSALLVIAPLCGIVSFADTTAQILISFNIDRLDYVTADTVIEIEYVSYGAAGIAKCDTRLEGETISNDAFVSFTPAGKSLSEGMYTIVAEATDTDGNKAIRVMSFIVAEKIEVDFYYNENEDIVPSVPNATAAIHEVEPFSFSVSYGTTKDGNISLDEALPYSDYDSYAVKFFNEAIYLDSASGIPYHVFDVDVSGKTEGEVVIRYSGSTYAAERIALKVYNTKTSAWDTVGRFNGSGSISEAVDIATYSDNGTVHVAAILDYETNGADTMIWSTDPQHYTKFDDLNEYYYKIYQYAADEYTKGNVGYILTTGDIVDDLPTTSAAIEQWKVADKAMSYIEEVGMPNGIVSGNHDVKTFKQPDYSAGDANVDYSKYLEYFNASRYNNERWYGGSLNNNISHYDLVTIGNVDFIVLFLGYGVEATDETIAWANEVLQMYSHRVAIVATHQYLDATTAKHSPESRADLIFERIVDPNPNVKMVLCGHDDGSLCIERTASDGRVVYEILSDYQFVEAEDDSFYENEHYIGSVPECCGDGYIRLLTVSGNTLSSITYSPVTGRYNPYGDRENVSIKLEGIENQRFIDTSAFSAYMLGEVTENSYTCDSAIVITEANGNKTYHHASYCDYPAIPEDSEIVSVDFAPLEALIAKASATDTELYTEESVSLLEAAIQSAENINAQSHSEVMSCYTMLANAIGGLEKKKEIIDPNTLSLIYDYDLTSSNWTTSDVAITDLYPGLYLERAEGNKNGWASVKNTDSFDIKPENGRIYMYLDIVADSAWSIYMEASQANLTTPLRLNFAIDNAFNRTDADSMNGHYYGVYDVTEAFVAAGYDVEATITVNATYLFIVPGGVSYNLVQYLTDKPASSPDKARLEKAISDAEALDSTLYTAGSYANVAEALEKAESALGLDVQAEINLAALVLEQAIDSLKLLSDIVAEPEGSLLPADEGEWKQNVSGTMKIFRDENNNTVLQNTNGEWPSADHVLLPAVTTSTSDKMIAVDVTVAGNTSFILSVDGEWVYLNEHITANRDAGSGDIKAGSYTAEIPLSKLTDKENITISTVRVFAVGAAGEGSAVTIRRLQITDYVAPPEIEDELANLIPESQEELVLVAGEGSVTLENGVITIVNEGEGDLRVAFKAGELFDLEALNALHLVFESEIPFKMAYNVKSTDNTVAWPNTSSFTDIFAVTDDRAAAGRYDVNLEIRDNCTAITDKSEAYFEQFIILVTGKGTFTLETAEMIAFDTFDWPEATYGEPAIPEAPVHNHAAKTPPAVSEKVDLVPYFKAGDHPIVSATLETVNGLGLEIDLEKTPYLYYSFIVPEGGEFTFSLYSNSNYSPWLSYLDAQLSAETPTLNSGAANWDSNTDRQQYTKTSQTGVIDMREYLVDKNVQKWIINQMKLYKSRQGTAVVSYLFFGSADAVLPTPDPTPDPDPKPDPDPDPDPEPAGMLGDVNNDGVINQYDYILIKRHHFSTRTLTEAESVRADVNKDGIVNQYDYLLVARHYFGTYVIA